VAFLLADQDEVAPPYYQQLVVKAYAGPKRIITLQNSRHNTPLDAAALADFHNALNWLWAQGNP
jgi:hypothetical protein